jgi:hypothetical protein
MIKTRLDGDVNGAVVQVTSLTVESFISGNDTQTAELFVSL